MAQTAALAPRKEAPSLISGTRAVGLQTFTSQFGREVSQLPGRLSYFNYAAVNRRWSSQLPWLYALRLGEERKMRVHVKLCHNKGILFVPLIVETIGGWSDEAVS